MVLQVEQRLKADISTLANTVMLLKSAIEYDTNNSKMLSRDLNSAEIQFSEIHRMLKYMVRGT